MTSEGERRGRPAPQTKSPNSGEGAKAAGRAWEALLTRSPPAPGSGAARRREEPVRLSIRPPGAPLGPVAEGRVGPAAPLLGRAWQGVSCVSHFSRELRRETPFLPLQLLLLLPPPHPKPAAPSRPRQALAPAAPPPGEPGVIPELPQAAELRAGLALCF